MITPSPDGATTDSYPVKDIKNGGSAALKPVKELTPTILPGVGATDDVLTKLVNLLSLNVYTTLYIWSVPSALFNKLIVQFKESVWVSTCLFSVVLLLYIY